MLSEQQREDIIHKLLSTWRYYEIETSGQWSSPIRALCQEVGFVKRQKFSFYIKSPDSEIITMANKIYEDTLNHFRFSDFYTLDNIAEDFLKRHEVICEETIASWTDDDLDPVYFWTDDLESKMKEHSTLIEATKIKLYKNSDSPGKQIDEIRAELRKVQKLYNELYSRKHQFDYLTAEDIASKLYTRYLYDNTFYTTDKKQVKGLPPYFLDAVASIVRSESITGTQFREIARTSPWLQIYKTAQPNPFAGSFLSTDILQLMSLTRWYEWVRGLSYGKTDAKTGETEIGRPSDKVIDDDDMLDGWYILFERQQPKHRDLQVESSKFSVENFVIAKSHEEADEVWNRNNNIAKGIMMNRAKQIFGSKNGVKNQELADVNLDIQIEANKLGFRAAAQRMGGKKG